MAYSTGTATDPNDLLSKLATFITANGWTQDSLIADGAGFRGHFHRSGVYANLKSTVGVQTAFVNNGTAPVSTSGAIAIYLGTGYNGAVNWNLQAGGPIASGGSDTVGCGATLLSGAITSYHFFADGGDNIVAVIEKTTGVYTYLGWGVSLATAGTITGGAYFFAGSPFYDMYNVSAFNTQNRNLTAQCPLGADGVGYQNGYVRVDVDTFTGKWVGMGANVGGVQGYTGKAGASSVDGTVASPTSTIATYVNLQGRTFSTLNQQIIILPVNMWANRDSGGYSVIGTVPFVFATMATASGIAPATEFALGGATYKVFHNFAIRKQ